MTQGKAEHNKPKTCNFTQGKSKNCESSLPQGVSKEEFFQGVSVPRSKEIMRIYRDMDLVEQPDRIFANPQIRTSAYPHIRKSANSQIRKFANSQIRKSANSQISKFAHQQIRKSANSHISKFANSQIRTSAYPQIRINNIFALK